MKLKHYPIFIRLMYRVLRLHPAKRLSPSRQLDAVVSLTSIASRLRFVRYAVASLLLQDPAPRKVVLWLSHGAAGQIPEALSRLQGERFEIRFREDVGPHTKLVYALKEFPGEVLVTADDDMLYESSWLGRLWDEHLSYPDEVIGHECRMISVDRRSGELLPYRQWPSAKPGERAPALLPLGYSGVLYPPGCLHPDATDVALFRALAPKADDLWFKAMSLINDVATRRSSRPGQKPIPVPFSQEETLNSENVTQDRNRTQWLALARHYGFELPKAG